VSIYNYNDQLNSKIKTTNSWCKTMFKIHSFY